VHRLATPIVRIEFAFGVRAAVAAIAQQAAVAFHPIDDLGIAGDLHAIADAERGAQQRRVAQSVVTQHAGTGIDDLHLPTGHAQHGAEAELRFGAGKPALAWAEFLHVSARVRSAAFRV